ncbi:hypothetical protein L798_05738 [Zootermopsis nevadensis]|uniref:Uncharacterized protein n=2 Tax=Zootermopsis nevadensis TaxID=136037 RepID=A0A067R8V2_ZOONE|nr:hypothetical protein L798_05738 [Zootermopsis nevadensis]
MGLEPSGKLLGAAEDLRLALHLTADLSTFKTTLSSLNVLNAANTEVEVQGGGAQDEIVNAIIRLVKPYFEQDILNILEDKITSTLEEALIDFDIGEILGL